MQKDMTSLQDKINAEKERHNKMIETVSGANKYAEFCLCFTTRSFIVVIVLCDFAD